MTHDAAITAYVRHGIRAEANRRALDARHMRARLDEVSLDASRRFFRALAHRKLTPIPIEAIR